jgi:hypothetical protein
VTAALALEAPGDGCRVRADTPVLPALAGAIVYETGAVHVYLVHRSGLGAARAHEIERLSRQFEGVKPFPDRSLSGSFI